MSAKSISARNRAAKLKAVASAAEGFQAAYRAVRMAPDKDRAMDSLRTATVGMLDAAAKCLRVLHRCTETYGASAVTEELIMWTRRWAAMPEAKRHDGVTWDNFATTFEMCIEAEVGGGAPDPWIGTLHHWADEESLIGGAQADTAARHAATGPIPKGKAMPQQCSTRDESWQLDPRFLEDVADEVHGLVFPPAPAANKERFKAQIEAAIECQKRHDAARPGLKRREREHRKKKVEQDARLRDRQAGPPADGWEWDESFVWLRKVKKGAARVEEGAWVPPDLSPPEPIPRYGSREDIPLEVRLMGQYVTLAIVHDDADAANKRGRPRLLTDFDLPPSFRLLLERAPHSRARLKVGGFDRATLKRALKDVKADLAKHKTEVEARAAQLAAGESGGADGENSLRLEDDRYVIVFEGQTVNVPRLLGAKYLAFLIRHQGGSFAYADIRKVGWGGAPGHGLSAANAVQEGLTIGGERDAGEVINSVGRRKANEALPELERQYDVETDPAKKAEIKDDIAKIKTNLAKAVDLKGKPRKVADPYHRHRVAVRQAIERTLGKIKSRHHPLWQHLHNALTATAYQSYAPSPPVVWKIED